jgi:hypothetical protein
MPPPLAMRLEKALLFRHEYCRSLGSMVQSNLSFVIGYLSFSINPARFRSSNDQSPTTNDKSMAQLSKVHPGTEGVVAEMVSRGPFIKPPAKRVVADSLSGYNHRRLKLVASFGHNLNIPGGIH